MFKFTALFILLSAPVCAIEMYLIEELTEYNYTPHNSRFYAPESPIREQQIPAGKLSGDVVYISPVPQEPNWCNQRRYVRNTYHNPELRRRTERTYIGYGQVLLKSRDIQCADCVMASQAGKQDIWTLYPSCTRDAVYIDAYGANDGGVVSVQGRLYNVPVGAYVRIPVIVSGGVENLSGWRREREYIDTGYAVPIWRQHLRYTEQIIEVTR